MRRGPQQGRWMPACGDASEGDEKSVAGIRSAVSGVSSPVSSPDSSPSSPKRSKRRRVWETCARDWTTGVIPFSMMGLQAQATVGGGGAIGVMQSVYLAQFGARPTVLAEYMFLGLPISIATSVLTVGMLMGMSMKYSWSFFIVGVCITLVSSIALTLPPYILPDKDEQATFISHYFGILIIIASVGGKCRDYPMSVQRVYLLPETNQRATEKAYNTIFDIMLGNGICGAMMLVLLASPNSTVKMLLVGFQVVSTVVSLCGALVLQRQGGPVQDTPRHHPTTIGAQHVEEEQSCQLPIPGRRSAYARMSADEAPPEQSADKPSESFLLMDMVRLTLHPQVWQLMVIEWLVGFIFTLNSQAAGSIYWSAVVGVNDHMRSVCIAIEYGIGGGLLNILMTVYVTRLYYAKADVGKILPRIIGVGALAAGAILAAFGTTLVGALVGITSLYLYFLVFPWSNIEFLSLLDALRVKHGSDNPLLYIFLIKDIIGGLLSNFRNVIIMWLLGATGYYEADCNLECASSTDPECVPKCHELSHSNISASTRSLVWTLYVFVTPAAYVLAGILIRHYQRSMPSSNRDAEELKE